MLTDIRNNPLFLTDVYNLSHTDLKEDVSFEVSHIYNRSRPMILYGFNEIVINLLNTKIEVAMVMEAEEHARKMGMIFPTNMWMDVVEKEKGWIPLRVQALKDGTWVPKGTPFAQVMNTVEGYGELVTWWEAIYLHSYFASACATEAFFLRKYLEKNKLPLHRFHSFGFRGHHSLEDAYWATTAWNLFLTGTDDFHGIYHNPDAKIGSIPATAHKTIQQFDHEIDGFKKAIDAAINYKDKIVALVIDTYDPIKVINNYMIDILQYASDRGVHVVFRPDSGDLIEQSLEIYKLYNKTFDNWSMIIGEGMSRQKVEEFDKRLLEGGFPLEKMSYGIGSGYYKHIDRDYLGHAMKTAFSNHKPRMKLTILNPFKQSIPNMVNLIMVDGKMTVEYTRDGPDHNALYYDVFHYDERSSKPKYERLDWLDIQQRAMSNLDKDLQEGIVLSPAVEISINEFKERYT